MITAYLTFDGNTEEAFNFYKSAFGGEFVGIQRFGDMEHEGMSEADKKKVMHVHLESSYGTLMGNDHLEFMGPFVLGNNISLSLHPDKVEEAKRVFESLSEGGTPIMPLDKAPWGAYFGMFVDKFGIKWMVNCEVKE